MVKWNFAIHKSLPYSAREVDKSIEEERELPGSWSSVYADMWTIVDPDGVEINDWERNKEDYRIEYLIFDREGNIIEEG